MNAVVEADSNSLAQRARRLGVADRYHGFWGKEEVVPDVVLERAVAAMIGDGAAAEAQHFGLPPVHVAREGERVEVRWTSHDDARCRWRLAYEDNGAEAAAGELQRSYQQAAIGLPAACW